MAADQDRPAFRGGRQGARDRWFGLEANPDFPAFRRWWHRRGKDAAGGGDLPTREDAEAAYEEWRQTGADDVRS